VIRQRAFLIRNRRRLALLAVFGALVVALSAEHSGLGHAEDGGDMGSIVSMCLAIVQAGVLLVGVASLLRRRPQRHAAPAGLPATVAIAGRVPRLGPPRIRAGPSRLQVFLR
jgi:hypothetical protein